MDFNIAACLHFASKGEGYLLDPAFFETQAYADLVAKLSTSPDASQDRNSFDYGVITNKINSIEPSLYYATTSDWVRSESKVVFSGLGADEVWAGYSRYKTAGNKGGVAALKAEMSLDLDRIWHRNMGRDDRVISVNGKETRFPFLDTMV